MWTDAATVVRAEKESEEKKPEKRQKRRSQRRERVSRKKIKVREQVGKSRKV